MHATGQNTSRITPTVSQVCACIENVVAKPNVSAEVIFWDAVGQYFVQTFDGDVPVEILEAVFAETKERVGVR